MYTPIYKICELENNTLIYMKREDLLPFSFGGNKVRIATELYNDMIKNKMNCMIGYGNSHSNMCRTIANICYRGGVSCHIISPADDDGKRIKTNNSMLVETSGAIIHKCYKSNVKETVLKTINECIRNGLKPYYMYGNADGSGNERILSKAYIDVYYEILKQEMQLNLSFDYIFLACGTGMTQSGLVIGNQIYNGDKKIIGISVARQADVEKKVIENYVKCYADSYNTDVSARNIFVTDEYLCGGYGKYSKELSTVIKNMYFNYGIALEPTYTGKAYWGMIDFIKKNKITDKKILFIHTGGLPIFFDKMNEIFGGK